ncbi:MAG TPA: hypothetical protein VM686_34245 [Polyangiaceae bacterium]|nr:hypothetical protein [Polyangiaceae bacterium]
MTIGGCYDASAHVGIKFSYKSSSKLYVSALTAGVAAAPEGQRNHWKKEIPAAADWTEATITWAELSQLGAWGAVVAWDATKIYGFDFSPDSAVKPISYDVSIDNLSFTP